MLKSKLYLLFSMYIFFTTFSIGAFDLESYKSFLSLNQSLSSEGIISNAEPSEPYYSSIDKSLSKYLYLDSIKVKYNLTDFELKMLKKNNFTVTERLSYCTFGSALRDIFKNDLPVFLSTDAILNTLHLSYDDILVELEKSCIQPMIANVIGKMRSTLSVVRNTYGDNCGLEENFRDVDLYLTVASSLIDSTKKKPIIASEGEFDIIWSAIQNEKFIEMPLFSTNSRKIDFSQFKVRGHYIKQGLNNYFKTMIWLERTEFLMMAPKQGNVCLSEKKDLQRMTIDAVLLTEILEASGAESQLTKIDSLLSIMIGVSDNCTPEKLRFTMKKSGLDNAKSIIDTCKYKKLTKALSETVEIRQKILSQAIIIDKYSTDSLEKPVSFFLLGQRFTVDSYIFGNILYDKIVYNNEKIKRLMPDPLDIAYALGNADAAPLLKSELQQWHYAPQLEHMRYLVNSYENAFWTGSFYNIWLSALRALNPAEYPKTSRLPYFMRTAAWHQEKLNTQLASWAQLRHDNLLYSKQSYTPSLTCSFPHGYVEPYPEFYRKIGDFARNASQKMVPYSERISKFYDTVCLLMDTLTSLAEKEIAGKPFTSSDSLFMAYMLIENKCGAPMAEGWFGKLIYNPKQANVRDFTIADVHTQSFDENGNKVGRILHAGVGMPNLGIFLAESPSAEYAPMAYVGPVSSYYQPVTSDFKRISDEEWDSIISNNNETIFNQLLQRPDWINSYCADNIGNIRPKGRVLKGITFETGTIIPERNLNNSNTTKCSFLQSSGLTKINLNLQNQSTIRINIFDTMGRIAAKQIDRTLNKGIHVLNVSLRPGTYNVVITNGNYTNTIPLLVIQ